MHFSDGTRLYSAKDLLNFLGRAHSSALDLQLLDHAIKAPPGDKDEYLDLLKKKGNAHEARYLGELKAKGKSREVERRTKGDLEEVNQCRYN